MDHLSVQVGLGLPTKKAASVLLKPNKGEGSGQVGSNVNRAYGAGTGKKGGWLVFWKNNISNTSRGVETKDQKTKHHAPPPPPPPPPTTTTTTTTRKK